MTQRVVPFLHTPLEAPEFLELWRETIRSGVARASEATAGGSGWKVTVKAGEVIIDGSWIYDDLDKIDGLDLGHVGGDKHYVVYQTYAYAGSDPPATSVFAVTAGVVPPVQPTIPAGAVKLCDIFVPAAAGGIGTVPGINQQDPVQLSSTGVRFVQAPRLWPVQDTGELMDRLIMSVGNTLMFTQGSIIYDDVASKLYFSQAVVVQSLCSTHRQFFNNAPAIVRTTIPLNTPAGATVPGTPGSRDVLVYVLVDRSSPNTALVGSVKFLNRAAPGAPELAELLDSTKRTQVVILGVINGSRLFMPGVQGQLPTPDADARKFLKDDPGGSHTWALVDDIYIKGGLKTSIADVTARDAIANDLRKQGLIAYVQSDDTYYSLIGGTANGNYAPMQDDSRLHGGLRVVSWTFVNPTLMTANAAALAAVPVARRKSGMRVRTRETGTGFVEELVYDGANFVPHTQAGNGVNWGVITGCVVSNPSGALVRVAQGQFRLHDGRVVTVYENTDVTVTTSQNVIWDRTDSTIKVVAKGVALFEDFVFAYANFSVNLLKFVACAPRALKLVANSASIYVGDNATAQIGTHFDTHYHALVWRAAHSNTAGGFKQLFLTQDAEYFGDTLVALPGTVAAGTAGAGVTITGTGTRFFRDFAVGDWIRVGTRSAKVASVVSDLSMTVVNLASTIPSAEAYTRPSWVGPHAYLMDTTLAEIGAIDGICVIGEGNSSAGHSEVAWGDVLAVGPVTDAKPFATGDSSSNDWLFENIFIGYDGSSDPANNDMVVIKAPSENWLFRKAQLDGGDALTHMVNLNTYVGAPSANQPGMRFEDCTFDNFNDGSLFFDSDVSGTDGSVSILRCGMFSCDVLALFELDNSSNLAIFVDDSYLNGIEDALVMQDLAGDWNNVDRKFRGCTISFNNSPAEQMIAIRTITDLADAKRVDLENCTFTSGVRLSGVRNATNIRCQSTAEVNGLGTYVPATFQSTPTGQVNAIARHEEIAQLHAFTAGFAAAGINPIMRFGGLYPIDDGAILRAGTSIVFPNGRVGVLSADLSIDIKTTLAGLHGALAAAQTVYYFFARLHQTTATIDALRYTTAAPTSAGALSIGGEAEVGYTATDYRYVGCMVTSSSIGSELWRNSYAVNHVNGVRRMWSSGVFPSAPNNFDGTDSQSGLTTASVTLTPNTLLPTAKSFGIIYDVNITDAAGSSDDYDLTTFGGKAISYEAPDGDELDFVISEEVPRRVNAYIATLAPPSGGSTSHVLAASIEWWEEDLNEPLPYTQDND